MATQRCCCRETVRESLSRSTTGCVGVGESPFFVSVVRVVEMGYASGEADRILLVLVVSSPCGVPTPAAPRDDNAVGEEGAGEGEEAYDDGEVVVLRGSCGCGCDVPTLIRRLPPSCRERRFVLEEVEEEKIFPRPIISFNKSLVCGNGTDLFLQEVVPFVSLPSSSSSILLLLLRLEACHFFIVAVFLS